MNKYLLDTNILINFFKKNKESIDLLSNLQQEGELTISALTLFEIREGWTETEEELLLPIIQRYFTIKYTSANIAITAAQLRIKYRKKGIILPPIDTLIAATALTNQMVMVTYDIKDFKKIKEITLYQFST